MSNHLDEYPQVRRRSVLHSGLLLVTITAVVLVVLFSTASYFWIDENQTLAASLAQVSDDTVQTKTTNGAELESEPRIIERRWSLFGQETGCGLLQSRVYLVEVTSEEGEQRIFKVCQGPFFVNATVVGEVTAQTESPK